MELIQSIDFQILDFIRENLSCSFLDGIMPAITSLGNGGMLWIIITAILLIVPKTRRIGLATGVALLIGFLITNVTLKPLVERTRPYDINNTIELLIKPPNDYSFPSGHTSAAFAFSTALFFNNKKIGIPFLIMAFIIGFSRLYLYVHFPTDVLAGAVIGLLSGYIGYRLTKEKSSCKLSR